MIKPSLFALLVVLALLAASTFSFAQGNATESQLIRNLRSKAEGGDAEAGYNLGAMYYIGEGVAKNYAEAVKWFRKAAGQGDASAQTSLALMYDNGEGVARNDAEAVKWYRRAADQGDAGAQLNLGLMYYKGDGVPKNDLEAYFWWNLAAAGGIEKARDNRAIIEKKMTLEQIAEAQRRSAAWKPKKE
jgi:TPR repeat protein